MKKIGFYIVLFFLFFGNSYAFDAKLSISKDNIGLDDYTKIRIQVDHDNTKDINIKEIKGLNDFVILSKSSSSSYNSNVVIIDGKTQTQTKSSDFIDLTVSPKKIGSYTIGPAIIEAENETKETNAVSINVDELKKTKNQVFDYKEKDDKFFLIITIFILLFLGAVIVYLYYFKRDLFSKFIFKINKKEDKEIEKNKEILPINGNNLDFPNIDDEDFVNKINQIFISKIRTKYYIEQIEKKSNEEIFELIPSDLSDKELIGKIIGILNKLKYSNESIEKNELIELIKKI